MRSRVASSHVVRRSGGFGERGSAAAILGSSYGSAPKINSVARLPKFGNLMRRLSLVAIVGIGALLVFPLLFVLVG